MLLTVPVCRGQRGAFAADQRNNLPLQATAQQDALLSDPLLRGLSATAPHPAPVVRAPIHTESSAHPSPSTALCLSPTMFASPFGPFRSEPGPMRARPSAGHRCVQVSPARAVDCPDRDADEWTPESGCWAHRPLGRIVQRQSGKYGGQRHAYKAGMCPLRRSDTSKGG